MLEQSSTEQIALKITTLKVRNIVRAICIEVRRWFEIVDSQRIQICRDVVVKSRTFDSKESWIGQTELERNALRETPLYKAEMISVLFFQAGRCTDPCIS